MLWGAGLIATAVCFPVLAAFFDQFETTFARRAAGALYLLFYFCSILLAAFGFMFITFGLGRMIMHRLRKGRVTKPGAEHD